MSTGNKYHKDKLFAKIVHTATSGVVGEEEYEVLGEVLLSVATDFTTSGTLTVQGRIKHSTSWQTVGTLTSGGDFDTFDIDSYDFIRFNFTVAAGSSGEIAASGFFKASTAQNAFATVQADGGTNPQADFEAILSIVGGNNITTNGDSSTDTITIASSLRYCHVYHEATSGTPGGTTANTWVTRTLNNLDSYGSAFATLSSNEITITETGTYMILGWAPSYRAGRHMCRLYDTGNTTTKIWGEIQIIGAGTTGSCNSMVHGVVSITADDTFELEHIAEVTLAGYGQGIDANGTWSSTHRWASLYIFKVA